MRGSDKGSSRLLGCEDRADSRERRARSHLYRIPAETVAFEDRPKVQSHQFEGTTRGIPRAKEAPQEKALGSE